MPFCPNCQKRYPALPTEQERRALSVQEINERVAQHADGEEQPHENCGELITNQGGTPVEATFLPAYT